MTTAQVRYRIIIDKFHELLRSGKDYNVKYMCDEAAKLVFLDGGYVMHVINTHYQTIISQDMIDFVQGFDCSREEEIKQFGERFEVCRRESILLIRYIRKRKNGQRKSNI